MRRDSLKTLGAIFLILVIVGVTFWYGNKQRQAQVKSDQEASQQQAKKSTQEASTKTVKPAPAPAPVAAPVASSVTPEPTSTPQTGSGFEIIVPLAALMAGFQLKRSSIKALERSLRTV